MSVFHVNIGVTTPTGFQLMLPNCPLIEKKTIEFAIGSLNPHGEERVKPGSLHLPAAQRNCLYGFRGGNLEKVGPREAQRRLQLRGYVNISYHWLLPKCCRYSGKHGFYCISTLELAA